MATQYYSKGHVRAANKDHLMVLSHARHKGRLQAFMQIPPPPEWDSVSKGWVGPVKDQAQCGSCHDDKTEVLTEKGYVLWPDYDWKTPLATMNPMTGFLEFQSPLIKHVYKHDGPMYYSDHRSLDFGLTGNHKMIWRRNKGMWVKSAIEDLPAYVDLPHATTGWAGTELERLGIGDRVYKGDDLLALIAIVISCGHVGHMRDGNGGQNNITFSHFREEGHERIRKLAHRLGIPEQASRPGVWYFRDAALAEWFRQNAYVEGGFIAPYKRIPMLVKCASQRQIARFLEYFGDQHTQSYGGRRFYSCSSLMMDDLQELLLRIGKRGTIEEHPARTESMNSEGVMIKGNYPEFMLTERKRDGLCLEKEHTEVDHYKGRVYCATVPNGSLVTRRNKRVLISSNCWDFSGTFVVETAFNMAGVGGGANAFVLSEQYTLSCQKNGGCNGDDNTTVLDCAKTNGLPLTSDYGPYQGNARKCTYKPSMQLYKLDDWGFADSNGGKGVTPVADIKSAIMQYGGVGCAIAADNEFMNSPAGKVFKGSGSKDIDHDVAIVGWDDSKGAWKLRNSWSPTWCDEGYMWIAYGANEVGTEAVWGVVRNSNPLDWKL